MLLQIGLMLARFCSMVASFRALFIMRTEVKKSVIDKHDYFGVKKDYNYCDMDVLTTGPIVRELSASFGLFWNSDFAIPVGATMKKILTEEDRKAMLKRLEENLVVNQRRQSF